MMTTGRYHGHSEESGSYEEYLEKMKNKVIESIELNKRRIECSSLKNEDKVFILSEMRKILNGDKNPEALWKENIMM